MSEASPAADVLAPSEPDPAPSPLVRTIARWVERGATWGLVAWCLYCVGKYVFIALNTVDFPYQLEWMEGGFVETVDRLMSGRDIYPPPGLDYVGYIYPPFYFAVSGVFSTVMGVDFFALRLVSFLSIMGFGGVLFRFVQRETGSVRWAIVGVGFFFATYDLTGRWFHLARVDSLQLFLVFAALYGLRYWRSTRGTVFAGVLMALAVLTKQTAAIVLLPAGLVLLAFEPRRAIVAGVVGVLLAGVSFLIMNAATDGWFFYYLFEVPPKHTMVDGKLVGFWREDVWPIALAFAASIVGLGVVVAKRPRHGLFYVAAFVGLVASAWIARMHNGGWINVVIPGFAAIAWLAAMGLGHLQRRLASDERRRFGGSPTAVGLAAVLLVQLSLMNYSVGRSIPPDDAQARGDQFLEYLASVEGDVFLPDWRWLPQFADKRSYGLGMAAFDLRRVTDREDRGLKLLDAELREAFRQQRFSQIILTDRHHPMLGLIRRHYRYSHSVDMIYPMVAGATVLPRAIFVPR